MNEHTIKALKQAKAELGSQRAQLMTLRNDYLKRAESIVSQDIPELDEQIKQITEDLAFDEVQKRG